MGTEFLFFLITLCVPIMNESKRKKERERSERIHWANFSFPFFYLFIYRPSESLTLCSRTRNSFTSFSILFPLAGFLFLYLCIDRPKGKKEKEGVSCHTNCNGVSRISLSLVPK
jgi:hypothetical protein